MTLRIHLPHYDVSTGNKSNAVGNGANFLGIWIQSEFTFTPSNIRASMGRLLGSPYYDGRVVATGLPLTICFVVYVGVRVLLYLQHESYL